MRRLLTIDFCITGYGFLAFYGLAAMGLSALSAGITIVACHFVAGLISSVYSQRKSDWFPGVSWFQQRGAENLVYAVCGLVFPSLVIYASTLAVCEKQPGHLRERLWVTIALPIYAAIATTVLHAEPGLIFAAIFATFVIKAVGILALTTYARPRSAERRHFGL